VVEPTEAVDVVRDPDDNRLIEAALAGDADVSGNQDLLTFQAVGRVRIRPLKNFLEDELPAS
jgi:predicted nucleic acid-binding protein